MSELRQFFFVGLADSMAIVEAIVVVCKQLVYNWESFHKIYG
jgi:hypothetical protein